jgi:hypothetical protein
VPGRVNADTPPRSIGTLATCSIVVSSTPARNVRPPKMRTPACRNGDTAANSSRSDNCRAIPGLNGWNPDALRMKSARSVSSSVADADAFRVVMKTDTNTTSPSPIISAAAVDAVRRGFRFAFSRPSRPVMPSVLAGKPIAAARGRAKSGVSTATPMKVRAAPTPTIDAG